jgi:hypothetical protein
MLWPPSLEKRNYKMLEQRIDLFSPPDDVDAICITTNGIVKTDGRAVMGRGVALAAREKFPGIDKALGDTLLNKNFGNIVFPIWFWNRKKRIFIFSFPTKNDWKNKSDINLIRASAERLVLWIDTIELRKILLPRPGCANGGLRWEDVKKVIAPILDDRFIIVTR